MKVTLSQLPGWTFDIDRLGCFRFATIKAPNGYVAHVGMHEGNPNNVLFMLAEELMRLDKQGTNSAQSST